MIKKTRKRDTFLLALFFVVFSSFLFSCKEKEKENNSSDYRPSIYKSTTGPINTITIVSDTTVYRNLYPFIREQTVLGKQLPGSLIPQSLFGFRNFTPSDFDDRKTTRIVINIKKGNPNFISKPSIYAKDQAYIEIYGNTIGEVKQQIETHKADILNEAERANFAFLEERLENDHKKELSKLGVYMKIPSEYNLVLEKPNYQWYRLDKIETISAKIEGSESRVGTQSIENFNIQVERFPIDKTTLSKEEIKSIIDGYGLNRLKGETDDEYMLVQKDLYYVEPALISDKYTLYDFDGMWEMKDSYYGGSFIGRIIIDKNAKELYMALISINAPNPDNKRDNILHAISMIRTFKVLKPNS